MSKLSSSSGKSYLPRRKRPQSVQAVKYRTKSGTFLLTTDVYLNPVDTGLVHINIILEQISTMRGAKGRYAGQLTSDPLASNTMRLPLSTLARLTSARLQGLYSRVVSNLVSVIYDLEGLDCEVQGPDEDLNIMTLLERLTKEE